MSQQVSTIDVQQLKTLLDKDPALCLIDVREEAEWNVAHILNAIHVPKDNLKTKIISLMPMKDHPIYLHCQGGTRSRNAAISLMEMGYSQVYSVQGGMRDWISNAYPVNNSEKK